MRTSEPGATVVPAAVPVALLLRSVEPIGLLIRL
jgi:hypothetical protein